MKYFALFFYLLAASPAYGEVPQSCHTQLLDGNIDSKHFYLPPPSDDFHPERAVEEVMRLWCPEYKSYVMSSECMYIEEYAEHSYTCIVETNAGYFFVNQDMMGGINLVFNRWD